MKKIMILCLLICVGTAYQLTAPMSAAGQISDDFQPGAGTAIGWINAVQGTVFIQHTDESVQYRVRTGLPLYMADTITTQDNGHVRLHLNDESEISLSPNTTIVLSRSVYDPETKTRSSFINMGLGKARYLIKKITGYEDDNVKVKTKTAVIGVRGSDFIVHATPEVSDITALEDTRLELISELKPDIIIPLNSFERIKIFDDGSISEIERIIREDINRIRRDFILTSPEAITSISVPEKIIIPSGELVDPQRIVGTDPSRLKPPDIAESRSLMTISQPKDIQQNTQIQREIITKPLDPLQFPDKPDL